MHAPIRVLSCALSSLLLFACIDEPERHGDAAADAALGPSMLEAGSPLLEAGAGPLDGAVQPADAALPLESGPREAGPLPPDAAPGRQLEPGTQVRNLQIPAADQQAFDALRARAESAGGLDSAGARAAYPVQFRGALDYDPNSAEFMDRIQSSALALSDGERAALGQNGFVISTRREFPTFLRGLAEIYSEHQPLFVSADALLEAVHSAYGQLLIEFEQRLLIPELRALLTGMRSRLASSPVDAETKADTDLYLAVALGLLDSKIPAPVAGADQERIRTLIRGAELASGLVTVTLFAVEREEDFSQFKPRGHYAGNMLLEPYFRAMMWLGRIDFRLLETQPDGSQLFRRRQYLASLLIDELIGPDRARFERIDGVLRTFVGESDYMVVSELEALIADLGGIAAARAASDETVAAAIVVGGYGEQQIASHLITVRAQVEGGLPLNRSFALLGQRYVVDSHVFSELVFDRLPGRRMMPTPLDAAFAALGNAQALALHPELSDFAALPGALARMRVLVDAHEDAFWDANFYNLWMRALRALSPAPDLRDPASLGLPQLAGTEAWGRRVLNAQLGSWAELRHDTLLYAKQSYSGVPVCGYPDAYVDPYPQFYAALAKYAAAGSQIAQLAEPVDAQWSQSIAAYFATLARATGLLGDMAERELRGEPFSDEQLMFINDAVRVERMDVVCSTVDVPDGWYADLFYQREKSIEFDPTIADVHTQPADAAGNIVGRVLHAGTGFPRFMVATIDTCEGPRAYAGVVYAYHEQITEDFQRLTDQDWADTLRNGPRPADVPWLSGVLAK